MNLVVYGRENSSTLWSWVDRYFSPISDRDGSPATYTQVPFPPEYTGKIVHYQPEASTNTLTVFWQTPSLQGYPRNAVAKFLSRYLEHKGQGSLLACLKESNYASDLTAGVEVPADSFYLFSVQLTLTDQGLGNVSKVISSVFQYAYLLANLSESDFNKMWQDFVDVKTVVFDYAEDKSPEEYTK